MTAKNKVEITNLFKSFGPKKVLKGVNLNIKDKESLVVIGGSGSGKSVLIKNVVSLMYPDSGSIKIDGQEVTAMGTKAKVRLMDKFGFLFQGGALFDSLKVWENVAFRLVHTAKLHKKDAKAIALNKLSIVGLDEKVAELYPSELSGGMKKRAALARAIAADPEIIFFDEPTTGLDPIMGDVINDLIVKSTKSVGATTLTITHDIASARKIADKIAMLYDGKIIWTGTVKELDKTKNPYVRQFIKGSSKGPISFNGKKIRN